MVKALLREKGLLLEERNDLRRQLDAINAAIPGTLQGGSPRESVEILVKAWEMSNPPDNLVSGGSQKPVSEILTEVEELSRRVQYTTGEPQRWEWQEQQSGIVGDGRWVRVFDENPLTKTISKPYPVDNEHNVFHDYHALEAVITKGEPPIYRLVGKGSDAKTFYKNLTEAEYNRCLRVLFNT